MAKRSLQDIVHSNKNKLSQDFAILTQLDDTFRDIPLEIGDEEGKISFDSAEITGKDVLVKGHMRVGTHTEELPLLKAKVAKEGIEFEFVQDIDMKGKAHKYTYSPKRDDQVDYNSFRNGLFNELHNIILKEYSGPHSVKLVRKRFKPKQ